jgi:hypothetical protein
MKFSGLADEELADIWYALAGSEIRHPGCFAAILAASNDELLRRKGNALGPFLDNRFRALRPIDAREDLRANLSASQAACDDAGEGNA